MNPLTPYMVWIKAGLAIALVLGIWFHGVGFGGKRKAIELAEVKADYAVRQAEATARLNEMTEEFRHKESEWSGEYARLATDYEDKKATIAHETEASVLADIRAGRIRVRFPACTGVSAAAQDAAGSGIDHGQADVRGTDSLDLAVARTIAIAQQADAQVSACQAAHKALRGPQ